MKMNFKGVIAVLIAAALVLALPVIAFADEDVVFTVQPQSAEGDNNTDLSFTWETSGAECTFMLQMRENETYDWGNVAEITSPYSMNMMDYTAQYRIMANRASDGREYFSDVFSLTWRPGKDITHASIGEIGFGDLPLGYGEIPAVPIPVTNIGENAIRAPKLELSEDGMQYFELIINREPTDIPAGATDSETWSVRPKTGMGIGHYREYTYLSARNIESYEWGVIEMWVVESGVEITYALDADEVDFGKLYFGYDLPEDRVLTVRSSGTGALTNVHIKNDDPNNTFFRLFMNSPTISRLGAGTDSGTNWYIRLEPDLDEGHYSAVLKVYADEIAEPLEVYVIARVDYRNSNEPDGSGEDSVPDGTGSLPDSADPDGSDAPGDVSTPEETGGNFPWTVLIIAVAVVAVAGIAAVVILKKKK
ncbi:MAG: hypothetical protein J5793_04850 [Clostridia bacterium]|nr:hypothetical protein [Clostridia bacterium]